MTKIEQIKHFQTRVHRFSLLMPIGDFHHHHTLYIMYASTFKSPKNLFCIFQANPLKRHCESKGHVPVSLVDPAIKRRAAPFSCTALQPPPGGDAPQQLAPSTGDAQQNASETKLLVADLHVAPEADGTGDVLSSVAVAVNVVPGRAEPAAFTASPIGDQAHRSFTPSSDVQQQQQQQKSGFQEELPVVAAEPTVDAASLGVFDSNLIQTQTYMAL